MSDMATVINRRVLRDACGRQIACPECDRVLDAPNAVLITSRNGAGIACGPCFDANWGELIASLPPNTLEIDDGRELFACAVCPR